jgi:hypothetical protein
MILTLTTTVLTLSVILLVCLTVCGKLAEDTTFWKGLCEQRAEAQGAAVKCLDKLRADLVESDGELNDTHLALVRAKMEIALVKKEAERYFEESSKLAAAILLKDKEIEEYQTCIVRLRARCERFDQLKDAFGEFNKVVDTI